MGKRLAALLLLLATACGSGTPDDGLDAVPTPTVQADPMSLVGMWRVQVDGSDTGVLRVGQELTLFQDCGALDASWKASHDGGFVAYSAAGDGTCFTNNRPQLPSWVHAAQGYRVVGTDRLLVDSDGTTLVRLLPGGEPVHKGNRSADSYTVPTPSAELEQRMAAPAPLPAGLTAATYATLAGPRWVPPDNSAAYLRFDEDGSFSGSDGCNGEGGRYALGGSGEILAVSGPSTLIGCQNSAAGTWLAEAKRAAVDDGRLVLLDGSARELGRLTAA